MKYLSLQVLVSLLGIGSIGIFFSVLTGLSAWWFTHINQQQQMDQARQLAALFASQASEQVVTDDSFSLFQALRRAFADHPDVRYAYIRNNEGRLLAHTFDNGFPRQLLQLRAAYGELPFLRFRTSDDVILEVAHPLMDGKLGQVHIGLSQAGLQHRQRNFLLAMGGILAISLAITLLIAHRIGKLVGQPLRQLAAQAATVPAGTLQPEQIAVTGTEEVRQLSLAFRQMVTDLHRLEVQNRQAQTQLLSTERLAALGELAAGLSHELLNPLDGVLECSRALDPLVKEHPRARKYVGLMQKGLERIHGIMRQMLQFARGNPEDQALESCSVHDLISDIMLLISPRAARRDIAVFLRLAEGHRCICSPKLAQQAFTNLLINAIDALDEVKTRRIELISEAVGEAIHIHVDDNGPGVPAELQGQLFTPFFTTKETGKGTGLGLSISRQLIQQCGGNLVLDPDPSPLGGARFTVIFPQAPSSTTT